VRERFILDPVIGLASIYPWLRNHRKYCPKCKKYSPSGAVLCSRCGSTNLSDKTFADEIVEEKILPAWKRGEMNLDPYEMYYIFTDYDIVRLGTRLPVGELEDITFNMSNFIVSQNILLVKILELKCRDIELEQYIDEMLGVRIEERQISEIIMEEFPELFPKKELGGYGKFIKELRDSGKAYTSFLKKIKAPKSNKFSFFKRGPYEHVFRERLSKNYAKIAAPYFFGIAQFIIGKMGVE
jgi:ribosomal protein L40E